MKSKAELFTIKHVRQSEKFREPSFDFLLRFLIQKKTVVSTEYGWLKNHFPKLDKFFWRADRRLIALDPKSRKIDALDVIHHGIHHLVYRSHMRGMWGFPMLTLYSEALASAADTYFVALHVGPKNFDHPLYPLKLQLSRTSKKYGIPFSKAFARARKNPFEMYKESVEEIFLFTQYCLKLMASEGATNYGFRDSFEKKIMSFPNWALIVGLDYHTFVYYVHRHCGLKSHRQDAESVKKLREKLRAASSMEDFLVSLETLK